MFLAVPYYIKHLRLARQLNDNAGESRANSSLAAALIQLNDFPKALYFLIINYTLAKKVCNFLKIFKKKVIQLNQIFYLLFISLNFILLCL